MALNTEEKQLVCFLVKHVRFHPSSNKDGDELTKGDSQQQLTASQEVTQ